MAAPTVSNSERTTPSDAERWYAAVGYLFFMCFLSLWKSKESRFVRFHARQAFLLFLAECVAFVAIAVIDRTVGRLPFLGLIVVVIAQVFVYLTALFLSVMGFVKALFGERWEMPFFGPYREKIPPLS
ncbi:MAG TPA: hypothetical protein VEC56_06435 [Candidatus Krumholzibacteria bacterium]|nr:hypothetical protein [Candidatus Krumholzibacteria bacterium]